MLERIRESRDFIQKTVQLRPDIGIILGSGLSGLGEKIQITSRISYDEIPHFSRSTVAGHHGHLLFGTYHQRNVVAMQGRFHFYEGYNMDAVTFPVRVMKALGMKSLIVSNASGGINPEFKIGDLMLITDHINLMINPLVGINHEELGPRFVDMSEPYHKNYRRLALQQAETLGIDLKQGVYAGVTGPTFETPAEYKYLRIIGADAVGMSTVPEVIAARHMNIPVLAFSVITDLGLPDELVEISHKEVLEVARSAEPRLSALVGALIPLL